MREYVCVNGMKKSRFFLSAFRTGQVPAPPLPPFISTFHVFYVEYILSFMQTSARQINFINQSIRIDSTNVNAKSIPIYKIPVINIDNA